MDYMCSTVFTPIGSHCTKSHQVYIVKLFSTLSCLWTRPHLLANGRCGSRQQKLPALIEDEWSPVALSLRVAVYVNVPLCSLSVAVVFGHYPLDLVSIWAGIFHPPHWHICNTPVVIEEVHMKYSHVCNELYIHVLFTLMLFFFFFLKMHLEWKVKLVRLITH